MNSKKHKLPRRILAMLLAICMFVTMFPSAMFAEPSDVSYSDKATAQQATGVTANKSVSGPDEDGNYTVTLDVTGTTNTLDEIQNVPADIVLVVDTSTSMEEEVDGSRCGGTLENMKVGLALPIMNAQNVDIYGILVGIFRRHAPKN